ncbi:type ISP restriction/modification enzyme [Candidatus Poriferisocius sp.]|uniref:type ISP restriction/modification enzyme n=1 Tax=Candidatus Poriferisocius sp. TaxID=3101276 RepID=UPI003B0125DE
MNTESFANMCAQTLVYGMLSSRVTNPEDFGASPIFSTVPLANPFLEAFFEQVHDQVEAHELTGSDLSQLVADLRETNVEAILDQIGSTAKGGDPVIHFYEDFLKKYDPKERLNAGAFYTPQPAVEFIVRAVDEVLRTRFNLEMGIADASTWQQVAERNGFEVPEGIDPAKPFVSMIDPATGTGTFLVEWLKRAKKSYTGDDWPAHLKNHVIKSMHAFELMLAPYAIAHLKVALELHDSGASSVETQILLTDTLDHAPKQGQLGIDSNPVALEGQRAANLKESERFTVVIGNPPYDREQRAIDETGRRKGGVVRHGVPGIPPLLEAVIKPMKEAGLGRHLKNIYNDYIYFWRWALWQATELHPGPGVVAFITASSYVEGVSFGGLRHLLRDRFDELWIIDLGGEGRGAYIDDNIFDIKTPVTIGLGIRTGKEQNKDCQVRYLRVSDFRADKLQRLYKLSLEEVTDAVSGSGLDNFTPLIESEYYSWPDITDLLPWIRSGCKVGRTWPIAENVASLELRQQELVSEAKGQRYKLFVDRPTGRRSTSYLDPLLTFGPKLTPVENLESTQFFEGIVRYGYRSFDRQWLIADNRLCDAPGPYLWHVRGSRQVYLTTLTSTKLGQGPVLTATPYVPDLHHFSGRGARDTIPLYRDTAATIPNITQGLLPALSRILGTEVAAEDLLAYVYGLGATPAFSDKFGERLAEATGPVRIPITRDPELFAEAVALGRDLLWWHTWGERFAPPGHRELPPGSAKQVHPVVEMPDRYDYDPATRTLTVGSGTFAPVAPEVWDFEVSGHEVLKSWLGYRMRVRKGRKSSPLDDIRPTHWTQTEELLLVLSIIEHTVEVTPKAADLLERITAGPLIPASDLPTPTEADRKPPKKLGTVLDTAI